MVAIGEACNGPSMSALEVKNIPNHLRNSVVAIQDVYTTLIEVIATLTVGLLLAFMVPQNIMIIMAGAIFFSLVLAIFTVKRIHT